MRSSIFSHTYQSYVNFIQNHLGKGEFHAGLIYKEWFQKGIVTGSHAAFNNAKKLFDEIIQLTDFTLLECSKKKEEIETQKFLLKTSDGLEIESVVIPMKTNWSLCVSSQVGCKMGCAFCETGKMGLIRNLSCSEIINQVFFAKKILGYDIRNIVFMGMGEPFDNYEEVMKAIAVLSDPNGLGFGPSRITVSTSGLVDKIEQFTQEADPAINLAISVNSPDDQVRNRLMPVNKLFCMQSLYNAMLKYCSHPRRRIFVEYVMIDQVTDQLVHAQGLAKYLKGLRVTVNLIPCNPQTRGPFKASPIEQIEVFAKYLRGQGYLVFIRGTKGQKIMAACGQLGNRLLTNSAYARKVS